jgi:hypothetical protein
MVRDIDCLICDKKAKDFYTTFFVDKKGKQRYGSICPKCYKKVKKGI